MARRVSNNSKKHIKEMKDFFHYYNNPDAYKYSRDIDSENVRYAKYRQEEDERKHVCNNMGGIYFSGHQRTDGTYVHGHCKKNGKTVRHFNEYVKESKE